MVKLFLLGRPEITATGDDLGHVPFGKPMAVFAYLAFGDAPVPRSELATLLWPGSSRSRARHSVREALSRLRGALGEDIFEGEDPIRVNRSRLWVDSDALGEALASGDLETANALWRGPFLEELIISDAPEWERWKDDARHRLEAAFGRALRKAGVEALDTGRPSQAARWFRRATEIQPYSVSAHTRLLETLLELRRLDVWEDAWRTATEHLAPLDALSELEGIRRRAAEMREEMRSVELRGGGPTVPFVGRSQELRSMFDAWARVRSRRAGTVILRGAAGVGKTRLAEEFIQRVEEDATWIHVSPGAEGSDRPLAVVRSLVAELRTRPGSRGTSPDFESLLEAVEAPHRALRDEWLDPDNVAAAISDLLGAVAFESPLVVLLDDAQRADEVSLDVLDRIVQRAIDAPVLLIVCTREASHEDERDVANRIVRAAGERPTTLIELRPFSEEATGRLLHSFLVVPDDGDEAVVQQVQRLTQGNALFVVEFVQALFQAGVLRQSGGRWTLTTTDLSPVVRESSTVAGLIASRLARLPEDARMVTRRLAEEEGPVPIMELRNACALDAARFVRSVALLSEWRIVRWLDDERIDLAHDRFREVGRELDVESPDPRASSLSIGWWAAAAVLLLAAWGGLAVAGGTGDDTDSALVRGGRLLHIGRDAITELRHDGETGEWTRAAPSLPTPSLPVHQLRVWRTQEGLRWMGTDRNDVIAPFAVEVRPSGPVDTLFRSPGDESPAVPSVDGRFAFLVTEDPETEVYDRDIIRLDLETRDTTRIYRNGGVVGVIDRAPSAPLLLIHAMGRPDTLLVMEFDGTVRHRISEHRLSGATWCGPGPEVAAHYQAGPGAPFRLGLINVLTGRVRELAVTYVAAGVTCAPDGSAILFRTVVDRRERLALLDRHIGTVELLPESMPVTGLFLWIPPTPPPRALAVAIRGAPPSIPMGESFAAEAVTTYDDGTERSEPVAWRASTPSVLSVLPDGRVHGNRTGRAILEAEALGGLRDSVTVQVTGVDGEALLLRDRFVELDSTRWFVASEPPPRPVLVRSDPTTDPGTPALDFLGDGRYADALVSRRSFLLPRGATVEVEFRMDFTRTDRQRVHLCLEEKEPVGPDPLAAAEDALGWASKQAVCVNYPAGELTRFAPDELAFRGLTYQVEDRLPSSGWTHLGIQLRADGEASLVLDREVVAVSPLLTENGPETRWRVVLGGAAVDTELLFRDLRLWEGLQYGDGQR